MGGFKGHFLVTLHCLFCYSTNSRGGGVNPDPTLDPRLVLQSCNACTTEKVLCKTCRHCKVMAGYLGHIGCLHRLKYDISRLYPTAMKIMALIPPQRFRFALLKEHQRDVRRRTNIASTWHDVKKDVLQPHDSIAIARR